MKRWMVETRVVVNRTYFVDAEDEKGAEAASCNATPDLDEEENEETMSISEVVPEFSCAFCQDNKVEEIAVGHGEVREIPCSHCQPAPCDDAEFGMSP